MYKFLKLSAATPEVAPEQETHTKRNLGMAAAAAAPFGGLIGQQKIIHDPTLGAKGRKFKSMEELAQHAQVGDILATSKPGREGWKTLITPFTGTPFYHTQSIVGNKRGLGTTIDASDLYERKANSQSVINKATPTIPNAMQELKYPDVVLLRSKTPLSAAQKEHYARRAIQRASKPYDVLQAGAIWAKEVFVPKLNMFKSNKQTICQGNVCSTLPSQALHEAGTRDGVVAGKAAKDVFPSDYLRSKNFELVGSVIKSKNLQRNNKLLRMAQPYLGRGALGVGAAGTIYGASEHPTEIAATATGALGASLAADAILPNLLKMKNFKRSVPSFADALESKFLTTTPQRAAQDLPRFLQRRLPILAAGGVAGYAGLRAFQQMYRGSSE